MHLSNPQRYPKGRGIKAETASLDHTCTVPGVDDERAGSRFYRVPRVVAKDLQPRLLVLWKNGQRSGIRCESPAIGVRCQ